MKCHFCMEREPSVRIVGPMTKKGPTVFELCEECAAAKKEADARLDNEGILGLEHNDLSELCVGCGVCCFVLHARVSHSEADRIVQEHGIKREDFVEAGSILYPDDLTIKMPCMFLLGKPLGKWTACKIHDLYRPEVCGSYLCKLAIRYQLGTISLNEARYWLRYAILSKDLSIFNWVKDRSEAKVILSAAIANRIGMMRKEEMTEEQIKMAVAALVTPHYLLKSQLDGLALDMHFATHDRGDDDPRVFFTEEELEDSRLSALSPTQIVEMTVSRVVATFRDYFDCIERSSVDNILGIHTERLDELAESMREEQ